MCFAFSLYLGNAPNSPAISAEVAYDIPVIIDVKAAQIDLPSSLSYAIPQDINNPPIFA